MSSADRPLHSKQKQVSSLQSSTQVNVSRTVQYHDDCSGHSIQNCRYPTTSVGGLANPDHSNEDRYFNHHHDHGGRSFKTFGVFDGHDGSNVSDLACQYMESLLTKWFTRDYEKYDHVLHVEKVLEELFFETENVFFKNIHNHINKKKKITEKLKDLTSYEAYIQFPHLVARLQEIEPLISANTGDSRAVLVDKDIGQGDMFHTKQLTVDHTIDNIDEMERLQAIGLESKQLKKSGRLGSQENTRCIGDYCIKEGYREIDSIRHAIDCPGSAVPTIKSIPISNNSVYLLLMTDGVYKTLESMQQQGVATSLYDPMHDLVKRIQVAEKVALFESVAKDTLTQLQHDHYKVYSEHVVSDPQSSLAIQCRKRDDMTLIVYKFQHSK